MKKNPSPVASLTASPTGRGDEEEPLTRRIADGLSHRERREAQPLTLSFALGRGKGMRTDVYA